MRKRSHVIPLRLTEQELAHLNRCSAVSGLPREEYLRSLIMGKTITPRPCTHHAGAVGAAGQLIGIVA